MSIINSKRVHILKVLKNIWFHEHCVDVSFNSASKIGSYFDGNCSFSILLSLCNKLEIILCASRSANAAWFSR